MAYTSPAGELTTSLGVGVGLTRGSSSSSLRRSSRRRHSGFSGNIRQQLYDQLKCLDVKLETEVAIVGELQEFFRRRAEVELDYARNLDKLVKQMITRHRAEKQHRQEQWATMSTYTCWKHLLAITRKESQNHSIISEIYSNQMVHRLQEVMDNSQRIFRKCREIGAESHEDILKVLNELQSAMKTYHIYQAEAKQAEVKLHSVESQRSKVELQLSGKNTSSRKLKGLQRQVEKKEQKYTENKLKALKARNDYLLCIEAANSAISKYFSDDISDLMDVSMDV